MGQRLTRRAGQQPTVHERAEHDDEQHRAADLGRGRYQHSASRQQKDRMRAKRLHADGLTMEPNHHPQGDERRNRIEPNSGRPIEEVLRFGDSTPGWEPKASIALSRRNSSRSQ